MADKTNILEKLVGLEQKAQDYGFDWPNPQMIIDHAISECAEIKKAIESGNKRNIQSEIGDLIHVAISLCVFLDYDVKETMHNSFEKFYKRMSVVRKEADKLGLDSLEGQSKEFMLELWNKAKKEERES